MGNLRQIRVAFTDFSGDWFQNIVLGILEEHFTVIRDDGKPEFLFYSTFGNAHLKYDCVKIFYTGENIHPNFNLCDYAIGFDRMQFGDRYLRFPLYLMNERIHGMVQKKHVEFCMDEHVKFCNFVYSNGTNATPLRERMFELLDAYRAVDSGGRYRNNIGHPVDNKIEFQRQYKFSIAFENASEDGYVTEKIRDAFAAGTIPIYWGSPSVGEEFNEKAFINCHAYRSLEEVAEQVKRIDRDEELYLSYIRQPAFTEEKNPHVTFRDFAEYILSVCSQEPGAARRRADSGSAAVYAEEARALVYGTKNTNSIFKKLKKITATG